MDERQQESQSSLLESFSKGTECRAWKFMGCHPDGDETVFRVWAPNAADVCVMGAFNGWNENANPMIQIGSGVWELRLPALARYETYKYAVHTRNGRVNAKSDPYAFHAETRPGNASKVYDLSGYEWGDAEWLEHRKKNLVYHSPLNIYEVHLGSWKRGLGGEFLSYYDLADQLAPYVKEMGFTHVELMPLTEHPLDMSWGYQCTGYFAATSRYGTPHDLMHFIDKMHQAGVGVILDWVPAHFPKDAFGLYEFDGTPTYEYSDTRKSEHADWGTRVFDYARYEVRSFLMSSAMFWLEEYHVDGLRVDAVASMLYLDYGRQNGQWVPNFYGGHENLEAKDFFRMLNQNIFEAHPDVLMIAEESTAWPGVTHPISEGEDNLGFNLKWNMGWMNDILHYIKLDPYFRQYNHKDITFSLMYAFSENYVLPLSHDEIVHMKGSLVNKMPGDDDMKFAGVRAFYGYMMTHPGKKLLMMGSEFGQWNEWHYESSLDWHLLEDESEDGERHRALQRYIKEANAFYLEQPALWELDFSWEGFEWICVDDYQGNCAAFLRKDSGDKFLVVLCNFSPIHRENYQLGVPCHGRYACVFNSDEVRYGGKGRGDKEELSSTYVPCHNQEQSITVDLPPMSTLMFRCVRKFRPRAKKAETALPEAAGSELPKTTAKVKTAAKAKPAAGSTKKAASTRKASSGMKTASATRKPRATRKPKTEE